MLAVNGDCQNLEICPGETPYQQEGQCVEQCNTTKNFGLGLIKGKCIKCNDECVGCDLVPDNCKACSSEVLTLKYYKEEDSISRCEDVCGDERRLPYAEGRCDDGNLVDGDGCS